MHAVWLCLLLPFGVILGDDQLLDEEAALCAADDTPICAHVGNGQFLLYANECDLIKAQRIHQLGIMVEGPLRYCLPNCDFACALAGGAVCGVSELTGELKTFANRCELTRMKCLTDSNWQLKHDGACTLLVRNSQPVIIKNAQVTPPRKQRRPVPCTMLYRPVCAVYSAVKSTFGNECLLNAENINTGKKWRIVNEGVCPEDNGDHETVKMQYSTTVRPAKAYSRKKRNADSAKFEDYGLGDDVVYIYAPTTFQTHFISSDGTLQERLSDPRPQQQELATAARLREDTPKVCKYNNKAVCAFFRGESRTFEHICALMDHSVQQKEAWAILHEGACRSCDFNCSDDYEPICVSRNGINYTMMNDCYLKRVRCKDPKNVWYTLSAGECASPVAAAHYVNKMLVNGEQQATKLNVTSVERPKEIETNVPSTTTIATTSTTTTSAGIAKSTRTTKPTTSKILSHAKANQKLRTTTKRPKAQHSTRKTTTTTTTTRTTTTPHTKVTPTATIFKKVNATNSTATKKNSQIATKQHVQQFSWEKLNTTKTTTTTTTPKPTTTTTAAPKSTIQYVLPKSSKQAARLQTTKTTTQLTTTTTTTSTAASSSTAKSTAMATTTAKPTGVPFELQQFFITDDPLDPLNELTSIYGPKSNSLIMRLVRAKGRGLL